jgi:hypothetical protein
LSLEQKARKGTKGLVPFRTRQPINLLVVRPDVLVVGITFLRITNHAIPTPNTALKPHGP